MVSQEQSLSSTSFYLKAHHTLIEIDIKFYGKFNDLLPLHRDAKKNKQTNTQNNLCYASHRTQRSIDRSEDVFVEYGCVISVAVVKRRLFLLVLEGVYFYFSKL